MQSESDSDCDAMAALMVVGGDVFLSVVVVPAALIVGLSSLLPVYDDSSLYLRVKLAVSLSQSI